jgi:hypothetical protein
LTGPGSIRIFTPPGTGKKMNRCPGTTSTPGCHSPVSGKRVGQRRLPGPDPGLPGPGLHRVRGLRFQTDPAQAIHRRWPGRKEPAPDHAQNPGSGTAANPAPDDHICGPVWRIRHSPRAGTPKHARSPRHPGRPGHLPDDAFAPFRVTFSKLEDARFFGHLELASIVQRAVKRAGLTVKYSQGFNPSMRMAFDNALPVGMESQQETFTVFLDRHLTPGAGQTGAEPAAAGRPGRHRLQNGTANTRPTPVDAACTYQIRLPAPGLDPAAVNTLFGPARICG